LELPYVATFRESQDYIRAAQHGLCIQGTGKTAGNRKLRSVTTLSGWLQTLPHRRITEPLNNIFPLWAKG